MTLNLNMLHTISSVWRDAKSGIGNNVKVLIKRAEDTPYTFCPSPTVTYTSSSTEISTHDASVTSRVTCKIRLLYVLLDWHFWCGTSAVFIDKYHERKIHIFIFLLF